jgi:hypothetical protein
MTHHLDNDAERIAVVRRIRKYISVVLFVTLLLLAFTVYKLLY